MFDFIQKKKKILLVVFFSLGILALYVRNFLGIDMEDEPYAVSSIFQVLQGKVPLMSIWDGHTGYFLLVPFAAIYKALVPSLEGVVLYFRIVGQTVALLIMLFNIDLLSKKYKDRAVFLYLLPAVFIGPILRLSYNSLSALLVSTICVLLYTSESQKNEWKRYLLAGLLAGILCLNYPTFSLIAIFLAGYVLVHNRKHFPVIRSICFITGVGIVGIGFFVWIFSKGSFEEFQVALHAVLDAPHTEYRGPINLYFFYRTFGVALWHFVKRTYILAVLMYFAALFVIHKKCPAEKQEKYAVFAFLVFATVSILPNRMGYGYAITGLAIGMIALLTALGKKFRKEHILFYTVEVLFVLIYSFTSDNRNVLLGVSASAPFLSMILCLLLYEHGIHFLKDQSSAVYAQKRNLYSFLSAILVAVGLLHSYGNIYGDNSFIKYSLSPVSKGVFRGQFTTAERKAYLEGLEEFADTYVRSGDKLSVITLEPMIYLMTDAEMFAPWTFDVQYLFKGFYEDDPLVDYFEQYQQYPDILIGTDKHNPDLMENPDYEIIGFIDENYTLVGTENIDGVNVYAWRKKTAE